MKNCFFEWAAPVCHTNQLTPVHYVWCRFDKDELWANLCEYRRKKLTDRLRHKITVICLKMIYKEEWNILEYEC
ncbi:DUF7079 family protein [Serratia sp. 2723]|uniref:DUF7079 family protein n=1 Tax=unclassified Serratia (in: enterobacteria) TaxID=2647522 RepID=UPI003D1BDE2B